MNRSRFLLAFLVLTTSISLSQQKGAPPAPPNAPAFVEIKNGAITVQYNGRVIFSGTMSAGETKIHQRSQVYREGEKIQQVILLTTMDWRKKIRITGTIVGTEESFPCEADRPTDRASQGPLIVRHASGIGRNLRNRAVYDRKGDWTLSVDANPSVALSPIEVKDSQNSFSIEIEGYEIVLRFRPHFFQKHRGLEFFEPWTFKPWSQSVAGWISWFAFFDKVSEKDMIETADVFSNALRPYGYGYFQMDDGYQRGHGGPDKWLTPNDKFPHGLKYLAEYIRSKGLKPGLWMSVGVVDDDLVRKHSDWFLRDANGTPVKGNWVQYSLDGSNPDALKNIVRPIFKGFREQGWEYFKVDGLRHLRYEGYNANRDYFDRKNVNLVDAYRKYALTVREEIGRDHFLLGCWGIRPELVGIIDGCRIGDDGFSYAGLAQYNSFNNSLEINRPFGSWLVLGRTGGEFEEIRFADLGLPHDREYLVFEFWTRSLKGVFTEGFDPGKISPKYNCQLFCIRERENHPQLIATSRHISCGGYELRAVSWDGHDLSGTSDVVAGDPYVIFVYEPAGTEYHGTDCDGSTVVGTAKRGLVREITLSSDSSATIHWRVKF